MKKIIIPAITLIFLVNNTFAQNNNLAKSKKNLSKEKQAEILINAAKKELENSREKIKNFVKTEHEEELKKSKDYFVPEDFQKLDDISRGVREKIEKHREVIKKAIYLAASQIEEGRQITIYSDRSGLGFKTESYEHKRLKNYLDAVKSNTVSVRALGLAIKGYAGVSKQLYQDAVREKDPNRKYKLSIQYTLLAHEMIAIAIEVIEDFTLGGAEKLKKIHQEETKRLDEVSKNLEQEKEDSKDLYKTNAISKETHETNVKEADIQIAGVREIRAKLNEIPTTLEKQSQYYEKFKQKLKVLKFHKKRAYNDIQFLAIGRTVKLLIDHIKTVETIADDAMIPLLPIDQDFTRQLLGIESPSIEVKPRSLD